MPGDDRGIELSPEHGLNPTLETCFFCGKETGTIALLGRIRGSDGKDDIGAPMHSVLGYEPCDECKELFAKGVLLMEAAHAPLQPGQPEIAPGVWPTGRHMVVGDAVVPALVADHGLLATILEKRVAFIEPEAFDMILDAIGGQS